MFLTERRFQAYSYSLLPQDADGDSGSRENISERKMQPSIPIKTTTYKVEANDTLTSVAARFDTTPSELVKLNRLAARTVFPGQVIRVPDKEGTSRKERDDEDGASHTTSTERSDNTDEEDMLETLRVSSPKPGHVERVGTPSSPLLERFLKINVRHITDGQGVVAGVLLVTPNALMFDPNVSDPLVIERGPEAYGVIAPMEYVVNAAIYHDIAHMRVANAENKVNIPKPEVYHTKSEESEGEGDASCLLSATHPDSMGDPSTKDTLPDLRSSTEEDDLWLCGSQREGDAFPKAFERELVTPTNSNIDKLSDTQETTLEDKTPEDEESGLVDGEAMVRAIEERRKSYLDHHWAIPKQSIDKEETDKEETEKEEEKEEKEDSLLDQGLGDVEDGREGNLVKLSCHDSGIDIRDPPAAPRKTVYSDADVLLSGDGEWVPPVPVRPLAQPEEKKQAAVSFSEDTSKITYDKHQDTKKNKMLKRLSYPLSWVEGITGSDEKEGSLPSSADSHPSHSSSVFSKVFSSSPINMVTDFSSNLFTKTPSEDGGKFPFPPPESSAPSSAPSSSPSSAPSSAPTSAPTFSPSNIISTVGRSSVGTFIRQQHTQNQMKAAGPKLDYRSMVSVEDMPELFVSFDKLIPRPARSCEDPPLYLRLRMGKPKDKRIPKSTPIMSYGKKKMRPEYWFSVPRERVDDLYRFLMAWVGHLYGDLDEEQVSARGYELVDSDTELWEADDGSGRERRSSDPDFGDLTRESWEVLKAPYAKLYTMIKTQATFASSDSQGDNEKHVTFFHAEEHMHCPHGIIALLWKNPFLLRNNYLCVTSLFVLSMSGELRRALYASAASLDLEPCLPDLDGITEILSEDHRKALNRHLPARAEGYVWTLVFSTSQHGFSLNSMYRKMSRVESPILMVIQDTDNNVFGALTSCSLKVSDHFYGTGESLLYRFAPECQVYNWTGDNAFFIKGNNESLSIGAGDGKFGLWLDGDLYQGRTESCATYGNEPLSPNKDFVVKTLECWAFI